MIHTITELSEFIPAVIKSISVGAKECDMVLSGSIKFEVPIGDGSRVVFETIPN